MKAIPTNEDIRKYRNVPVDIAAAYLGINPRTLRYHMQDQKVPFGFACQSSSHWSYHISPEGLIKYQNGELSACDFKLLVSDVCDAALSVIHGKLGSLNRLLDAMDEVIA